MKIAFMGTPEFSVPCLQQLAKSEHQVVAVYTQPPRPSGRGHKLTPSPVETEARALNLPVRSPVNFKSDEERTAFADLDLDLAVVVAYGLILTSATLQAPRLGCLNIHASLLPRWRGAAPVQRAIMAGDTETGVQIMQMEKGLDTGAVLSSTTMPVSPIDTSGTLHQKLSEAGANLLMDTLSLLASGKTTAIPQSETGVTYAAKILPEEARIDWSRPANDVDCHIRGLAPFPGAWFEMPANGKLIRCKALMSQPAIGAKNAASGQILNAEDKLVIACADGEAVELITLQRAGKSAQESGVFLRGTDLKPGTVLT